MERFKYTKEDYERAVWEYMLDHCDITKGGAFFVKFHTKDHASFHNHVLARVYRYHRNDPVAKEGMATKTKEEFELTKEQKEIKYKQERDARMKQWQATQKEIKRVAKINERNKLWYWQLIYNIIPRLGQ